MPIARNRMSARRSMRRIIHKQGYLKKLPNSNKFGAKLKKQERRWFVFGVMNGYDPYLEYYETEEAMFENNPINIIFLDSCVNVSRTNPSLNDPCAFTLVLSDRYLSLVATSRGVKNEWCRSIEANLTALGILSANVSGQNDYVDIPNVTKPAMKRKTTETNDVTTTQNETLDEAAARSILRHPRKDNGSRSDSAQSNITVIDLGASGGLDSTENGAESSDTDFSDIYETLWEKPDNAPYAVPCTQPQNVLKPQPSSVSTTATQKVTSSSPKTSFVDEPVFFSISQVAPRSVPLPEVPGAEASATSASKTTPAVQSQPISITSSQTDKKPKAADQDKNGSEYINVAHILAEKTKQKDSNSKSKHDINGNDYQNCADFKKDSPNDLKQSNKHPTLDSKHDSDTSEYMVMSKCASGKAKSRTEPKNVKTAEKDDFDPYLLADHSFVKRQTMKFEPNPVVKKKLGKEPILISANTTVSLGVSTKSPIVSSESKTVHVTDDSIDSSELNSSLHRSEVDKISKTSDMKSEIKPDKEITNAVQVNTKQRLTILDSRCLEENASNDKLESNNLISNVTKNSNQTSQPLNSNSSPQTVRSNTIESSNQHKQANQSTTQAVSTITQSVQPVPSGTLIQLGEPSLSSNVIQLEHSPVSPNTPQPGLLPSMIGPTPVAHPTNQNTPISPASAVQSTNQNTESVAISNSASASQPTSQNTITSDYDTPPSNRETGGAAAAFPTPPSSPPLPSKTYLRELESAPVVAGWNVAPPTSQGAPPPYMPKGVLEKGANTSLREAQVQELHTQMKCASGMEVTLRRKDCHHILALADYNERVWIIGWNQTTRPLLSKVFHIGDQLVSINGQVLESSKVAYKLIKQCKEKDKIKVVVKRLPLAKVYLFKREYNHQSLGIKRNGGTAEVISVEGLALRQGFSPHTSLNGTPACHWWITEVNSRPLNLFYKGNEIETMLRSVGKEMSIVVQPMPLILEFKKQLKAMKSHKDFLLE